MADNDELKEQIQRTYAKIAINSSAGGCCSGGCSCNSSSESSMKVGYTEEEILSVPSEANMGLGCGNPTVIAALKEGEMVLDLGSGGGFDCFLARRQVGETGYVIGVDMTPEMIVKESGYTNVEFRLGEIEHLPIADRSIDVIISNCVINLSLDKEQVFKEAYRVLKPGGRLSISDVVATAELPEQIKQDLTMLTGCVAGAEYVENIRTMMQNAGCKDIKFTAEENSKEILMSWVPNSNIVDYVASYVIEATKSQIVKKNKINDLNRHLRRHYYE